jgi:hypothetical protein
MKKIILNRIISETIAFKEVREFDPIFVKDGDRFVGMVIKDEDKGWIIRADGDIGVTGCHDELFVCLESGVKYGYTYHVESED